VRPRRRECGLAAAADDAQRRAEGQTDNAIDGSGVKITCAEIARRWLAFGESTLTGVELARTDIEGWPLGLIRPENIDRIETNFQIALRRNRRCAISAPTISSRCRLQAQSGSFEEAPLENQIDRERFCR